MARTTSLLDQTHNSGSDLYKTAWRDILLPCWRNHQPDIETIGNEMKIKTRGKSSRLSTWASLAAVVVLAMLLMPTPALAYLDPGTGSFLIQGVIAVVVGAGLFWGNTAGAECLALCWSGRIERDEAAGVGLAVGTAFFLAAVPGTLGVQGRKPEAVGWSRSWPAQSMSS